MLRALETVCETWQHRIAAEHPNDALITPIFLKEPRLLLGWFLEHVAFSSFGFIRDPTYKYHSGRLKANPA